MNLNALSQALTTLKHQEGTPWLKEVSSVPLQQALRHLKSAYPTFFEGRSEYPTLTICLETLSVKNMLKNHCLAKDSTSQNTNTTSWAQNTLVRCPHCGRDQVNQRFCSFCGGAIS